MYIHPLTLLLEYLVSSTTIAILNIYGLEPELYALHLLRSMHHEGKSLRMHGTHAMLRYGIRFDRSPFNYTSMFAYRITLSEIQAKSGHGEVKASSEKYHFN